METAKRTPKIGKLLWCLAGVLWLAGCYGPSALDQDYGNAYRNNLAQTVLNPRAGLQDAPRAGLAPTAGVNELEQYNKGFKGELKKPMEMKITY